MDDGRPAVLLYGGDFDPSGEDILRDFTRRTNCWREVRRVALTAEQVEEYGLPELPGKTSDARAGRFIARHHRLAQVEIDALDPNDLEDLFEVEIDAFWEQSAYDDVVEREDREREAIVFIDPETSASTGNPVAHHRSAVHASGDRPRHAIRLDHLSPAADKWSERGWPDLTLSARRESYSPSEDREGQDHGPPRQMARLASGLPRVRGARATERPRADRRGAPMNRRRDPIHVAPATAVAGNDHSPSVHCWCAPLYVGRDLATGLPVYQHRSGNHVRQAAPVREHRRENGGRLVCSRPRGSSTDGYQPARSGIAHRVEVLGGVISNQLLTTWSDKLRGSDPTQVPQWTEVLLIQRRGARPSAVMAGGAGSTGLYRRLELEEYGELLDPNDPSIGTTTYFQEYTTPAPTCCSRCRPMSRDIRGPLAVVREPEPLAAQAPSTC